MMPVVLSSLGVLLCGAVTLAVADEPYEAWFAETVDQALPQTQGSRLSAEALKTLAGGEPTLPFSDLAVGVRLADGTFWVGSSRGLMQLAPQGKRWRLFHSRRWLPDDRVRDIAVTDDGAVLVETPAGVVRLARRATTLAQKMQAVGDELRLRHVRQGLICDIYLNEPGRVDAGWRQNDDDNDGLWTSLYVGAEAFRYGATGDAEAKRNARRSLEALMFLERITGIPGFVARSIWPIDAEPTKAGDPAWRRAADGRWWWKGTTSSDELDGHYFAYALYYDLVADEKEKQEIRGYVARITDHIIDNGYYLIDFDGKPTRWGVWAPEKLNHDLNWIAERGLNSLEILSHLKVAEHITGDAKYADAARELIEKHSYHINTVRQKVLFDSIPELGGWANVTNHSDDELAFLAYYPLLRYEQDPELRRIYLASIERSWHIERPEGSPLFNLIYAASLQASKWPDTAKRPESALVEADLYDRQTCLNWFRDVPEDLITWTVRNSGREDLGPRGRSRGDIPIARLVLPIYERRLMKWNGDPYELDGGSGGEMRSDGTFVLLPYWMGQYHRLLD